MPGFLSTIGDRTLKHVAWGDGHVSKSSPGAMAVGTDYDGVRSMFQTKITDRSQYRWDGAE